MVDKYSFFQGHEKKQHSALTVASQNPVLYSSRLFRLMKNNELSQILSLF